MTVRRIFSVLAALYALLLGAGCGDRDGAPLPAETDEPIYVQGVTLKRQGRHGEALTAFLKVIERRGERGAAESHFEAGDIFLNHAKDPAEAYHHFRKYLELQPNSKQADLVRGQVDKAKREFWRQLAGRSVDDPAQSVRVQITEEVSKLRRENDELRAELSVLRGGGATPVNRPARMITLPAETTIQSPPPAVPTVGIADSPIKPAPAPRQATTAAVAPSMIQAAPPQKTGVRPATTGVNASRTVAVAPPSGGRTHTVKPKESIFGISKQYGVKMEDLAAANGIRDMSKVPVGTVLKIPGAAPATKR